MGTEITMSQLNRITEAVIGCSFTVIKTLGRGYLEKVYENALAHECRKAGLRVEQQRRLKVMYDGIEVGDYIADMVVEGFVLIEIKAAKAIDPSHEAQCIIYLAATGLPICLLLNFTSRVEVRRFAGASAPAFVSSSGAVPVQMTWAEQTEFVEDLESNPE